MRVRDAINLAVDLADGNASIPVNIIPLWSDPLYALATGADTDAKREAYEIIRAYVNAEWFTLTESSELVAPYDYATARVRYAQ